MLKDILNAFQSPRPTKLNTDDVRVALGALLVRVARADGEYAQVEKQTILRVLARRFDLGADDAQALCTEAEDLESQAPDTVRFTRVVKEGVAYEDRASIVEVLWEIALADGARDNEESNFLRLTSDLLGVTDRDSAFARQRVITRQAD
ncbi:hypothetical protein GCM10007939_08940 [Amylibacter marinus]|uniref:Co-chaperone DjlA N-terminal domain-containing protein n=1 Tax=Amylibacter marinus TaxID=1475483 RepID=A0ABQ5VTW8_9RHOB|nr:TerB family tellurite resistance protein [Amylibacter marinus]GLQ34611.1 hypothetical protein GCM10007939_08940 [Amylibacter marinus]